MAYCIYETDVQPRSPQFTARNLGDDGLEATKPSLDQCRSLIDQVSAEIDARLAMRGRSTPVADDEGKAMLLPIAAIGSAAAVLRAAFPQKEGIGGEGGAATGLQEEYEKWLVKIDEGLLDHESVSGGSTVAHGMHHWHHPLRHHHHHEGWDC